MPDIKESDLPVVTSIEDSDLVRVVYSDLGTLRSATITRENLIPSQDYILITDTKSANTSGGTFTSGSWQTRTLNTENVDTGNNASLASNQITLAAGTYRVRITVPAFAVSRHKAVLYNVTSGSDQLIGTSSFSAFSAAATTLSIITGRFTIASSTVFEVRHMCQSTKSTDGFGVESNFGVSEVYTVFEAWKE